MAPSYDIPDYPSVREQPQLAALEIYRLTEEGRIFWYEDEVPTDLDICPSTLIVKMERSRLVHDWTRAGLNEFLVNPPTAYDTIDVLISALRPNGFMLGWTSRIASSTGQWTRTLDGGSVYGIHCRTRKACTFSCHQGSHRLLDGTNNMWAKLFVLLRSTCPFWWRVS